MRWLAVGIVLLPGVLHAQPSTIPDATETQPFDAPIAEPSEPVPPAPEPVLALDGEARNYEREPAPASIRGGAVVRGLGTGVGYVLRVVLSPVRGILYAEDRWGVLTKTRNLFINDAETAGLYPTATYATGFGLTYGARAFVDNYLGIGEDVSISAKTGGAVRRLYQGKLGFARLAGSPVYVRSRVRYEENVNLLFAEIGNGMDPTRTRFSQERFLTVLSAGVELGDTTRVRFGTSAIYNDRSFGPGSDMSDPSIETVYDTSTIRGFDDGVRNLELTADLELDTRDAKGPTNDGAVLRAFAGGGSLVEDTQYAHYGVEAAYYVSPFWPGRVFVGRIALEGIRDKNDDIPFSELPRLGGAATLRGYSTDQFRDKLAAIATLEYRYPIHANISGELFVESGKVGRTYGALVGDGATKHWHVGYGGGLIIHSRKSVKARINIAYGDGISVYFSTDLLDAFHRRETEL